MNKAIPTGLSAALPADARKWLAEAAAVGTRHSQERTRAIEEAIRRIKLKYPLHFSQEQQA